MKLSWKRILEDNIFILPMITLFTLLNLNQPLTYEERLKSFLPEYCQNLQACCC